VVTRPFPPPPARVCVWGGAQSLSAGQRPRPLTARALYAGTSVSVGASEASMGSGIDVGSGHWCAQVAGRCAGAQVVGATAPVVSGDGGCGGGDGGGDDGGGACGGARHRRRQRWRSAGGEGVPPCTKQRTRCSAQLACRYREGVHLWYSLKYGGASKGAAAHQPVEHLEQERPASGSGRSWSAARAAQAMRPAS